MVGRIGFAVGMSAVDCDANEPLHIVCDLIAEISGRTLASFAVAVAAVHGATRYGHCDVPSFVWQHPKEGRTTPVTSRERLVATAAASPGVTDETRAEIVASIYDDASVRGYEVVSVRLTPAAMARGMAFALSVRVSMARPAGFEPATL